MRKNKTGLQRTILILLVINLVLSTGIIIFLIGHSGTEKTAGVAYNQSEPEDAAGGAYDQSGTEDAAGVAYDQSGTEDAAGVAYDQSEPEDAAGGVYETAQKYTLYIGLNDKDTYRQMISTSRAREIVNGICAEFAHGYTSFEATGGWTDQSGALTQEDTLVYMFYNIDEDVLAQIMDGILDALNQNSILVERGQSVYTYYSGFRNETE